MRLVVVLIALSTSTGAQTLGAVLDPEAVPAWRVAAAAGVAAETRLHVRSVSVERAVAGPLGVGARLASYTTTCWGRTRCSGEPNNGGTGEVYVLASTRSRHLDVRGLVGGGVAAVQTFTFVGREAVCQFNDAGRLSCTEYDRYVAESTVRPALVGGIGVDIYPLTRLGVGVEVRAVVERDRVGLSEAAAGLRVRLGR
ncbi:MAG: hypothetical protein AAGJ11_01615 [Bacteroidota bacterium]